MKILLVSNSITGGGAEKSMRLINSELIKKGIDSTLVCLNNAGDDYASESEVILNRAWRSGVFGTIRNYLDFVKLVKAHSPTTVVANCELPELYVALAPVTMKNIICVEHTSQPWAGRNKFGKVIRWALSIRNAKWVTVNRTQNGIWPFGESSIFIPNPVVRPGLAPKRIESPKFAFVGRLRKEKGIELVLSVAEKTNFVVDVFGSGNLEEQLKERYKKTGVFHGFVANPWADINVDQTLVVASEYEGDGIVVVEAILAGVPILLKDNYDLRRFGLPDKNYFKNSDELAHKLKIASVACNEFRVTDQKTKEYLIERDITKIVEKWIEISV